MTTGNQGFPQITSPIAGNLKVTQPWYQMFITLWNRTGGGLQSIVSSVTAGTGLSATPENPITSSGTISLKIATTSSLGGVIPDGQTVDINGSGKISVPTATTSSLGIVKPDGLTVDVAGDGTISVPIATTTSIGLVKPDGTTVDIAVDGTISVPDATTTTKGIVEPDDSTLTVAAGIISIEDNGVTNAKLAQVPAKTFKGNHTAVTADSEDMTVAQALAILGTPPTAFTPTDLSGASLTFTGVSSSYSTLNGYTNYSAQLTYPTTSDTNAAAISVPVAPSSAGYAAVSGSVLQIGGLGAETVSVVAGSPNKAIFANPGSAGLTNANLSGKTIFFTVTYPTT